MKRNPISYILYTIGGIILLIAVGFLPVGIHYATGYYYQSQGQMILSGVGVAVVVSALVFAKASEIDDLRKIRFWIEKMNKTENKTDKNTDENAE